ncbi:DUF664 domain-containing protein [Geodermatophilus sp. DF01-2]|nr:DUF664 domain-containing protein [Geodermatophilus sp. DF01_2]
MSAASGRPARLQGPAPSWRGVGGRRVLLLLAKLDGLDEYAVRRPMTPTGTNLLGLVKHVAYVQLGYFGEVFGRPSRRAYPWDDGGEPDADMWATAEESRADVVELYRFSAAHADATIAALPLDAVGTVPWWREERRNPTLHTLLVHVCVEVARHARPACRGRRRAGEAWGASGSFCCPSAAGRSGRFSAIGWRPPRSRPAGSRPRAVPRRGMGEDPRHGRRRLPRRPVPPPAHPRGPAGRRHPRDGLRRGRRGRGGAEHHRLPARQPHVVLPVAQRPPPRAAPRPLPGAGPDRHGGVGQAARPGPGHLLLLRPRGLPRALPRAGRRHRAGRLRAARLGFGARLRLGAPTPGRRPRPGLHRGAGHPADLGRLAGRRAQGLPHHARPGRRGRGAGEQRLRRPDTAGVGCPRPAP